MQENLEKSALNVTLIKSLFCDIFAPKNQSMSQFNINFVSTGKTLQVFLTDNLFGVFPVAEYKNREQFSTNFG